MKTTLTAYTGVASFVTFVGLLFLVATCTNEPSTQWLWINPILTMWLVNGLVAIWIFASLVFMGMCKEKKHELGRDDMHPIMAPTVIGGVYGFTLAYQMWNYHPKDIGIVAMMIAPLVASILGALVLQQLEENRRVSVKQ